MANAEWARSSNYPGEGYWSTLDTAKGTVYTQGAEFVVRNWPGVHVPSNGAKDRFPVIAGPLSTFEAALAAARIING